MRSAVSGPLYGASRILAQVSRSSVATSQTGLELYEVTVPATEDWQATRAEVYCTVAGSAAATVDIKDDGTSVLPSVITLTANAPAQKAVTADASEDIVDGGKNIAAGSAVTFLITTGATTGASEVTIALHGYARYVGAETP